MGFYFAFLIANEHLIIYSIDHFRLHGLQCFVWRCPQQQMVQEYLHWDTPGGGESQTELQVTWPYKLCFCDSRCLHACTTTTTNLERVGQTYSAFRFPDSQFAPELSNKDVFCCEIHSPDLHLSLMIRSPAPLGRTRSAWARLFIFGSVYIIMQSLYDAQNM